jgi:hypothetical protein
MLATNQEEELHTSCFCVITGLLEVNAGNGGHEQELV